MAKLLEIFKPGTYVALSGKLYTFSEAQLKASAAAYDPAKYDAPFVVGHPKLDAPAYGWAKSLAFANGVLAAEPDRVDAQFAAMVNAGRFPKISASFYEPDAPGNPVPGVYYVRHIGFLGAQPPAVTGLKNASFAEDEQGVVNFADWSDSVVASLFRSLRDAWIAKFGKEEADKIIPDYSVTALTENAAQRDTLTSSSFSEPDMETATQIAAREAKERKLLADQETVERERAELARKSAEFAAREKTVKDAEDRTRRAGIVEFAAALVKDGKILPRDQEGLVAYLAGPNDQGVIEFAEGEGATKQTKSVKPDAWLREFLGKLPKQVDYAELAARTEDNAGSVTFAAPPGYSVDPVALELHSKAIAYQKQHAGTSYEAAIAAVTH